MRIMEGEEETKRRVVSDDAIIFCGWIEKGM